MLTDTPVFTSTPTPTFTSTATVTPSPTLTPTPAPVCNPNTIVHGTVDEALPEYIDMLGVFTRLDGTHLTVVFTLRGIPEEVTIDRRTLGAGTIEIAWGVAIDTDNNQGTGSALFMTGSGHGYEYLLQAFNIKEASERSGTIQDLFRNRASVWMPTQNGGWREDNLGSPRGVITVNREAKTITLSGRIKGITPDSYLHFFTAATETVYVIDEICAR
jgi:hypothetical protein